MWVFSLHTYHPAQKFTSVFSNTLPLFHCHPTSGTWDSLRSVESQRGRWGSMRTSSRLTGSAAGRGVKLPGERNTSSLWLLDCSPLFRLRKRCKVSISNSNTIWGVDGLDVIVESIDETLPFKGNFKSNLALLVTGNWQVQILCDWPVTETHPWEYAGELPDLAGWLPTATCLVLFGGPRVWSIR